jgi:hypothetical protein
MANDALKGLNVVILVTDDFDPAGAARILRIDEAFE